MSNHANLARGTRDHLDLSKNHEAGLIPVGTRLALEAAATGIETLAAEVQAYRAALETLGVNPDSIARAAQQ